MQKMHEAHMKIDGLQAIRILEEYTEKELNLENLKSLEYLLK